MSEEALQIAVKRREAKGKGGKERYTHLNAEFQRRARRDKKAFQTEQCKEIEENKTKQNKNKQKRKSRDFFKKIKIPREHFMQRWHSKRQKWYGPNRSRKIVRRGGTNTQKNYTKNIFMTQIITMV